MRPSEPRRRGADLLEPAESFAGGDEAVFGIADEAVDGRELVEAELDAERRREFEHDRLPRAHRHHEVRREGADAGGVDPEGASHLDQPLLDDRRRLAHLAHRRPEPDDERQDIGILRTRSGRSPVVRPPQRPLLRAVELLAGEEPLVHQFGEGVDLRRRIDEQRRATPCRAHETSTVGATAGRAAAPGRVRSSDMSAPLMSGRSRSRTPAPGPWASASSKRWAEIRSPATIRPPTLRAAPSSDAAHRSSVTSTSPADPGGRASAARRMSWADSSSRCR